MNTQKSWFSFSVIEGEKNCISLGMARTCPYPTKSSQRPTSRISNKSLVDGVSAGTALVTSWGIPQSAGGRRLGGRWPHDGTMPTASSSAPAVRCGRRESQ